MLRSLATLLLTFSSHAFGGSPSVVQLLKEADAARGHLEAGVEFHLDVECSGGPNKPLKRSYVVRSKEGNAVGETLSPAEFKGEKFVANGRYIFQFKLTAKRPIAVTLADRQAGLASVGDLLATTFQDQFDGKVAKIETLQGQSAYLLNLEAKIPAATYRRVNYWVSKKNGTGLKVQMLMENGEAIQTVEFKHEHKFTHGGKKRPFASAARFVHRDGSICEVAIGEPKAVDIKPEEFDVEKITAAHKPS